ncbi:MAG: DegT/DnrJ/EryC1/StrS family aminotransferase [Sphingobacteriales bacterium]|mgnify:CR=1 FL=1|nr:DegT/DnrJ/EryC1/StrS family aminotransferase [Sphingobacteriales bacterium]OJY81699.1 MAG: glutamine--scyllo-inositol aminotransferase [Sphingobacteriales bacterium 44-15]
MKKKGFSRRRFLNTITTAAITTAVSSPFESSASGVGILNRRHNRLALLGGAPVRPSGPIGPPWPYVDELVVDSVVKTTRSGVWSRIQSRNGTVPTFEESFAKLIGTKYSVGTGSGTQALSTCVEALGIGPGDEVITSPYTDFGTISSILTSRALPVLADLEPDTYQLDPAEVEKRINKNTKAIMPVHIFGVACNMERIMAIAKQYNLKVIEDACQAPLARYQGKGLGTIGDVGCFSFQASKPIACGEGGAVVGNDEQLMDECYTVQNRGANRKGSNATIGPKYRMNEFEGAILMGQFPGIRERFETRNANANYLRSELKGFNALKPQRHYPGTESGAYYHFGMTYDRKEWGVDRSVFLKAVAAEGVSLGSYIPYQLHHEPWVDHILGLKSYKAMYSPSRLKEYRQGMDLPNCDRIIKETMVSFAGSGSLLAGRDEMKNIVDAIMKVYENRDKLKV